MFADLDQSLGKAAFILICELPTFVKAELVLFKLPEWYLKADASWLLIYPQENKTYDS